MEKVTRDSVELRNLCLATNIIKDTGIKKGEMVRECSTDATDEKLVQNFSWRK
jgi:hypothetical protein